MANYIAGGIKRPGALTRKAKDAGMSNSAWARAHLHAPGVDGQEARMMINVLNKVRPGARRRSRKRGSAEEQNEPKMSAAADKKEEKAEAA